MKFFLFISFLLFACASCGNSPEHKNGNPDTSYHLKKDSAGR